MSFIKNRTVYQRREVHVYINECHRRGRKTRVFAVRRDDAHGRAALLGGVVFDPRWRQYIFEPEPKTKWSWKCQRIISDFCKEMTDKWRQK